MKLANAMFEITFFSIPFCLFFFADACGRWRKNRKLPWSWTFFLLSLLIIACWRLALLDWDKGSTRYWLFPGYMLLICAGYGIVHFIRWTTGKFHFMSLPSMLAVTCFIFFLFSAYKIFIPRDNVSPQQTLIDAALEMSSEAGNRECAVIFHYSIDNRLCFPAEMCSFSTISEAHENNVLSELQAAANYRTIFHLYKFKQGNEPSVDSSFEFVMETESRSSHYRLYQEKPKDFFSANEDQWVVLEITDGGEKVFSEYEVSLLSSNKLPRELFNGFDFPEDWMINIAHMWGEHCCPFSSRIRNRQWDITSRDFVNFYRKTALPAIDKTQCIVVSITAFSENGASLGTGIYPATRNYSMFPAMPVEGERECLYFIPAGVFSEPNPRLFIYCIGTISIRQIKYQILNLPEREKRPEEML